MGSKKIKIVNGFDVIENEVIFHELPEINGSLNTGCSNGLVYANRSENVFVRAGVIEPEGYLAAHKAAGTVYVCIMSGNGKIGLADTQKKSVCEIQVEAGDEIVFTDPMELHYYMAGPEGLEYRVISFQE